MRWSSLDSRTRILRGLKNDFIFVVLRVLVAIIVIAHVFVVGIGGNLCHFIASMAATQSLNTR